MRGIAAAPILLRLLFLLLSASHPKASFAGSIQEDPLRDAIGNPDGADTPSTTAAPLPSRKWGDTILFRFSVGTLIPTGEIDFIDRVTRIAGGIYAKTTDRLYLGGSLQFMFPTVSGTAAGYPLEPGSYGGGSLELGAVFYLLSRTPRMQPYLGLTVGGGGFDWVYAEEVYEEFPDGFPDDVTTGTGIVYLATQIGADWGPFSMGTRFLLTRHVVTGDDFEARYGRGDYLEFYLALVKRDWHP